MTKVALYARVSTRDKDQNLETQLLPLREAAERLGYEVRGVYVDQASAQDIAGRRAWRYLLGDAAKKQFKLVLVFKLDRAFRSVKDMHDTLAAWEVLGIEFSSLRENFETRTAYGRLMLNLLASMAEFELEIIRERVVAGMDRARATGTKSGKPIGRPRKQLDVQNILNAFKLEGSIRGAARIADVNPGHVCRVVQAARARGDLPAAVPCPSVQKGDAADGSQTEPPTRALQTTSF